MRQEMIIQIEMHCDKCRSKAMRIATEADGNVISVAIRGPDRDQLVVIGEGVDAAKLTGSLRRKFPTAAIVSVQSVSNAGSICLDSGYYSSDDHERQRHEWPQQYSSTSYYVPYPQYPVYEAFHYVPNPPSICTIM